MPAQLKDASSRSRRNKSSTKRTLEVTESNTNFEVPDLPSLGDRDWHPLTIQFWDDVWSSPMASEYLVADIHGLYRLATLVDDFWIKPSNAASAEIRLAGQPYGLTPLDRRRLEWSVEQSEDAKDRGQERRRRAQTTQNPVSGVDPRTVFSA